MATKTTKKKTTKTQKKAPLKTKVLKSQAKKAQPSKTKTSNKGSLTKKHSSKKLAVSKRKTISPKQKAPAKKSSVKHSIPQKAFSKDQDLATLSNLSAASDLDMMAFRHVSLGNLTADIVYSSNDTAVICKILSDEHAWTVDITKPIENCVFTDETGAILKPCSELLAQVNKLHQLEEKAKITAAIVLMRGSIKNEKEVIAYLQKHHIHLVKYNGGKAQDDNDLQYLLNHRFTSFSALLKELEKTPKNPSPTSAQKEISNPVKKSRPQALSGLATLWKFGYFPKGSGTLGALIALPIAYALNRTYPTLLWVVTGILFVLGLTAVQQFTSDKKEKDPGCVIIDEVVGQLVTFLVVIPDFMQWPMLYIGFALFRFFDIFKFGPVAFWDRRKNPMGVMMDDVTAGVFSGFVLAMLQVVMVEFFGL